MSNNTQIKSDLAKARGLGSAHHGTGHWMHQKLTAIANIPLVIWFVFSMISLIGASYAEYTAWLAQPINAILMILLVISTFYHAVLGSQVVVEDYISHKGLRLFKIIGQKLFFFAFAVACIFSILKVAFTV
ncbi:MAG: succinate dehydrogenase, hydrophobic membrane anchor protein [Pseudomonadota bacterium]